MRDQFLARAALESMTLRAMRATGRACFPLCFHLREWMPRETVGRELRAIGQDGRHEHAGAAMTVRQAPVADRGAAEVPRALAAVETLRLALSAAVLDLLRRFRYRGARDC